MSILILSAGTALSLTGLLALWLHLRGFELRAYTCISTTGEAVIQLLAQYEKLAEECSDLSERIARLEYSCDTDEK